MLNKQNLRSVKTLTDGLPYRNLLCLYVCLLYKNNRVKNPECLIKDTVVNITYSRDYTQKLNAIFNSLERRGYMLNGKVTKLGKTLLSKTIGDSLVNLDHAMECLIDSLDGKSWTVLHVLMFALSKADNDLKHIPNLITREYSSSTINSNKYLLNTYLSSPIIVAYINKLNENQLLLKGLVNENK